MSDWRFPSLVLPKRWSREKRKTERRKIRIAQWWGHFREVYKAHIDKTWADPPQSIDWGDVLVTSNGTELGFVDDIVYLP